MIFVTVGHQMPFDRLVKAVDDWAARESRDDVVAQIGAAKYRPKHLETVRHLAPAEFRRRMQDAEAIVAHAGMGTIITALELGKPLLVMPRLARLGETRSDHQIATARHFSDAGSVLAATDETDLPERLAQLATFEPRTAIQPTADPGLLRRLREFTHNPAA